MESFIYDAMNRASREKDKSKIEYYGAFAAALSYIIYSANENRKSGDKLKGNTYLYRGLKMKKSQIDEYKAGAKIDLIGYTSTTKEFEIAHKFAFDNLTGD